jgi:hypothetical protein
MSDQNQNEPNQKQQREMLLFYTPIYNLVIQSRMLGLVERDLVFLFASYHNLGCNWARASLMERSECGPYLLDRAILRLEFMHIIHTVQGRRIPGSKRREKNRYTFQTNPYLWRVTKEMQELIIEETKRMGKEPQPFKYKSFPNQFGLEKSFAEIFPKYAKGKKGRKKNKNDPQPTKLTDAVELAAGAAEPITESESMLWDQPAPESESQKWRRKTDFILNDELPFIELAMEYYSSFRSIEKFRNDHNHNFSHHKQTYLERLHAIYTDRRQSPKGDEAEVFTRIEKWLDEGLSYVDINAKLGQLNMERKMSQEG